MCKGCAPPVEISLTKAGSRSKSSFTASSPWRMVRVRGPILLLQQPSQKTLPRSEACCRGEGNGEWGSEHSGKRGGNSY